MMIGVISLANLDHLPGFAVLIQQGIEARPHPDLARVLAYAF